MGVECCDAECRLKTVNWFSDGMLIGGSGDNHAIIQCRPTIEPKHSAQKPNSPPSSTPLNSTKPNWPNTVVASVPQIAGGLRINQYGVVAVWRADAGSSRRCRQLRLCAFYKERIVSLHPCQQLLAEPLMFRVFMVAGMP